MSITIHHRLTVLFAVIALSTVLTACEDPEPTASTTTSTLTEVTTVEPGVVPASQLSDLLFSRASTVVVAGKDPAHAAAVARALKAPVVPASSHDEVSRLGATTRVKADDVSSVAQAKREHPVATVTTTSPPLVVTTTPLDPLAAANAATAGATVVETAGDPRRDPAAIAALDTTAPVLAIGSGDFGYQVSVIHDGAEVFGGGYLALGKRHYLAMYGHPSGPALGVLGEQGPQKSVARVKRLVRKYRAAAPGVDFQPAFEVIASVAIAGPGKKEDYSALTPIKDLMPLVNEAEKNGVTVILDLQPGRSDFLSQATYYEPLLRRPHVGLALDPEWRLGPRGKPLQRIGHVKAAEINRVSAWLADLTRRHTLPQKVFVLHQFQTQMIRDRSTLRTDHPELATVIHVDGQGPPTAKLQTWRAIRTDAPAGVAWGWKNFLDEDEPMLTVAQTWARVKPHPALITYQ